MQRYVVGFIFSPDFEKVVLIRKDRPEWQRGLLNGIGGKVEPYEDELTAMVRECSEETGINIPQEKWTRFAHFVNEHAVIDFYFVKSELWHLARTMETEMVAYYLTYTLPALSTIPNLQWLIPLAVNWDKQNNELSTTRLVTIEEH